MKKFYIMMMIASCFVTNAQAQDDDDEMDNSLQFQMADGTPVENGSVVNCTTITEDDFNGNYISSGLYLKNVSEDDQPTAIVGTITALPQGSIQFCMLQNCNQYSRTGAYTKTGIMKAGNTDDLMLEWLAAGYDNSGNYVYEGLPGKTATITLQTEIREPGSTRKPVGDEVVAYGPAITINFTWPNSTGITATEQLRPTVVARYNLHGERISQAQRGVNILLMSDGSTIKQLIR